MSDSLATPWTVAHSLHLSVVFPCREDWSGLPFLLQGIFLTQDLTCVSSIDRWILYYWITREAQGRKLVWNTTRLEVGLQFFSLLIPPAWNQCSPKFRSQCCNRSPGDPASSDSRSRKEEREASRKGRNLWSFSVSFSSVLSSPSSLTVLWQRQQQNKQLAVGNCRSQGSKLRGLPVGKAVVMKVRAEAWLASPAPRPPMSVEAGCCWLKRWRGVPGY